MKKPGLAALHALGALVLSCLASPAAASEVCPEATTGICFSEYTEISAVAAVDGGYAAIASGPGGLDLLTLDAAAQPIGEAKPVALPEWLIAEDIVGPAIKRLVPGADGAMLAVGWASIGSQEQARQIGVLVMLDRAGSVLWARQVEMQESVILYSAAYDAGNRRFLVVGRHTNGQDNGTCTFWSQAIVMSVPEADSDNDRIHTIGAAAPGLKNRAALQDIAPTAEPGQFIATGFATQSNGQGSGCQDNAMAVLVSGGAADDWNVTEPPYTFGSNESGEVAFAAAAGDIGYFLLAGHGVDARSKARAALVAGFQFGAEPVVVAHAYPEDASDTTGGDRYRLIVPLRTPPGSYLVAGSASESRAGRNQGIWRVLPAGLEPASPAQYLTREVGSDITGAALGRDGRVLAVGTHGSGNGTIGWMGFISEPTVLTGERREPDTDLQLFTEAEIAAGSVSISQADIAAGKGYRHPRAAAGDRMDVTFSLSAARQVAITALPARGDVDLALMDGAGRVVAFSSNLNDAGEYVSAALGPGDYRLRLVAVSETDEYEVRLTDDSIEDDVLVRLLTLNATSRQALTDQLQEAGYGPAGNPDIGFGADTVRAVLASLNTTHTDLDPDTVEQFIVGAFAADQ